MEAIKVENLSFSYPGSDVKALNDVSFSLNKGSFNLLMGESGSGKTTLLKLLKKEIGPIGETKGVITVLGESPDSFPFNRIGFVSFWMECLPAGNLRAGPFPRQSLQGYRHHGP